MKLLFLSPDDPSEWIWSIHQKAIQAVRRDNVHFD